LHAERRSPRGTLGRSSTVRAVFLSTAEPLPFFSFPAGSQRPRISTPRLGSAAKHLSRHLLRNFFFFLLLPSPFFPSVFSPEKVLSFMIHISPGAGDPLRSPVMEGSSIRFFVPLCQPGRGPPVAFFFLCGRRAHQLRDLTRPALLFWFGV